MGANSPPHVNQTTPKQSTSWEYSWVNERSEEERGNNKQVEDNHVGRGNDGDDYQSTSTGVEHEQVGNPVETEERRGERERQRERGGGRKEELGRYKEKEKIRGMKERKRRNRVKTGVESGGG